MTNKDQQIWYHYICFREKIIFLHHSFNHLVAGWDYCDANILAEKPYRA